MTAIFFTLFMVLELKHRTVWSRNASAILQLFFQKIRYFGIFWSKFLLKNAFLNGWKSVLMRFQGLRPGTREPLLATPLEVTADGSRSCKDRKDHFVSFDGNTPSKR